MTSRTIQIAGSRSLLFVWALIATACGGLLPANPLSGGPPHGLSAFMGVRFGDSLDDVQRRFPLGSSQTSPYGAPAYKIEDASSGSVEYQDVIYEFSERSGMQMVIAHFAPSANADVYQQLQTTLGAPTSTGATNEGATTVEAEWRLSDGSSVRFNGRMHRVVLLGKDGRSLEVDIHLREPELPSVS